MKKILVLYHSGVGNTKLIAENIFALLLKRFCTQIFSVENLPDNLQYQNYDGIIIGFPVIHTHPSKRILKFINGVEKFTITKPLYIFTTCGWYSANSLRIFSKQCIQKNMIPVMHSVFSGCPASDGSLLMPFVKRFFVFAKNIDKKIERDVNLFLEKIESGKINLNMPRFKLYSILNYPNKLAGQLITFPIFVHRNKCVKCGKCIQHCPAHALLKDQHNYPVFIFVKCEKCYRCIHHCSALALSLSKRKTPEKVLGGKFLMIAGVGEKPN